MDGKNASSTTKGLYLCAYPVPLESSRFRANAVICHPNAEGQPEGPAVIAESPKGIHLISEEAVVEYARSWAIDWIDKNPCR